MTSVPAWRRGGLALVVLLMACGGSVDDRTPASAPPASAPPASIVESPEATLPDELAARAAHTATTLADGRVLLAGGCVIDGCGVGSAETFLIAADGASWTSGPVMTVARSSHTTTPLADGRAVIVGGFPGEGQGPTTSVDLYEPTSDEVRELVTLGTPRGGHAAVMVDAATVLVVGGWIRSGTYTASTELIDANTGEVRPGDDLPWAADALDATPLGDGRILVTGGQTSPGEGTDRAALWDPESERWRPVGPMTTVRFKHFSLVLPDGRVLVMGGTTDDRDRLSSTEIFDPTTGTFTAGPSMNEPRYKMTGGAAVLGNGRVVVGGGGRTVEVLDLAAGTSTVLADLGNQGSFATLNLLDGNTVLVLGGYDDRIDLRRAGVVLALDG